MKANTLESLLTAAMQRKQKVLITGAPGVGKTHIVQQAAAKAGSELHIFYPSISDPIDAKGFPMILEGNPEFVPFGELRSVLEAIKAGKKVAIFLDDLGQGTPAVQASYMSLIDRLNGLCAIIAATNRRTDKAGVTGILEPVKSRFTTIVSLEVDADSWSSWAVDHNIETAVLAFIRFRPDLLHQFTATQDIVNQPCPRTWAALSTLIDMTRALPMDAQLECYTGAVGQGAAAEFAAFMRVYASMPSLDGILLDPASAPIPSDLSTLYAVSVGLASKATEGNFDRVAQYANRLDSEGRSEFAVLMLRDAVRRNSKVCNTASFIQLASGKLGKLISGTN